MLRLVCMKCSNNIVKFSEDGDSTATCIDKLRLKYTIYRILDLLVLVEFVIQLAMHGRNNMKVIWYKSPNMWLFIINKKNFYRQFVLTKRKKFLVSYQNLLNRHSSEVTSLYRLPGYTKECPRPWLG